jgi:3-oxoacyl-[acyl-carrier-protein] synthase II
VVFTGLGVVSPIGVGRAAFWAGLREGRPGLRPVTLFDTAKLHSHLAGEVPDFDPEPILGKKGLRLLDRTTRLALAAAALALDDAGLAPSPAGAERAGVVLATTVGSAQSRGEFFVEAIRGGPRAVNPALFPNTVVSSPASQVAIRFGLRGPNTTIASGFTASLRALDVAARLVAGGQADLVLAGGVEELSELTYAGFHNAGLLAAADHPAGERSVPFDRHRHGLHLGEGAVILVAEPLERARARGARVLAEYGGAGTAADLRAADRYDPRGAGLARAVARALARAGGAAERVDCVAAGANGSLVGDAAEAVALDAALGAGRRRVVAFAVKSQVGETWSAGGAFQAGAACLALAEGIGPATLGHAVADPRCPVDPVPGRARPARVDTVLLSAPSPMVDNVVAVLGRCEP